MRPARIAWYTLLLAIAGVPIAGVFAAEKVPPARSAEQYAASESHGDEHVSVAADPLDARDKQSLFQVDYLKAGFLPVRLIVTNNGNAPIRLDQVRVYFVTADGEKLKAAQPEDVERRVAKPGDPTRQMEAPFPLKGIIGKPGNKDAKVEADFKLADFAELTVAAHATQSGYLFFDVSGMDTPLRGAALLVRRIEQQDGTMLASFAPQFDKYLAAKRK